MSCIIKFYFVASTGDVPNFRLVGCHFEWDDATVLPGCEPLLEYKIRVYTRQTFLSTPREDRRVIISKTNSAAIISDELPNFRPLKAMVRIMIAFVH